MGEILEVQFRPANGDLDPALALTRRMASECRHARQLIDETLRTVTCRDCQATLDPVECMVGWANDWTRVSDQVKSLRHEVQWRRNELAALLRRARNLRAQMRRDSKSIDARSKP